jgi:hypothetical protein
VTMSTNPWGSVPEHNPSGWRQARDGNWHPDPRWPASTGANGVSIAPIVRAAMAFERRVQIVIRKSLARWLAKPSPASSPAKESL